MSELSKQALKVENNQSFPNNNTGYITPSRLRDFNVNMIDSLVDEETFNSFSQSVTASIEQLQNFSSSLNNNFASQAEFTAFTASTDTKIATLSAQTSSYVTEAETASFARTNVDNNFSTSQTIVGAITASTAQIAGIHYPTADNGAKSFIQTDGAGNLSFQFVDAILEEVRYGENITIGDPLYISGSNGTRPLVWKADAAVAAKMPVIYIATSTNVANTNTTAMTFGLITGVTTAGFPVGTEVYVAEGGGWSASRPSGSTSVVQPLGIVTKEGAGGSGRGLVLNPGPANLPNLQTGYAWVGNANNQPTAVATSSFGGGTIDTGSFATTGSNTFNGSQTVNGTISASADLSGANVRVGDTGNFRFLSGSSYYNVQLVPDTGGDLAFSRSGVSNVKTFVLGGTDGANTSFQNNPVVFNGSVSSLTVNAQSTAISGSGSYTLSAASISEAAVTAQLVASSSVIGTFSVTGQTGGDGKAIMLGHSGSLVIGNSQNNAYYADLAFISSSQANANTNLIFKTNTNTNSLTLSGSANLIIPPSTPTAEFKRYIGGSGNIILSATAVPQITGSNTISPTFTNNTHQGGAFNMRTPVSSSTWTVSSNTFNNAGNINFGTAAGTPFVSASAGINFTNSFIGGTISATAYKTTLYAPVNIVQAYVGGTLAMNNDSSSIQFSNASMQGTLTINNSYNAGTTTSTNALSVTGGSMFFGVNHNILASGSNTTTSTNRQVIGSVLIGTAHSASAVLNGDNSNINATALIGHSLAVTGSSALQTAAATAGDRGTVIVGRFNAEVQTGNTVFAVGTGTSTSNRRNTLLIDSGSNTTISGSVAISGSVNINQTLTLGASNPLPTGTTGMLAVSASVLWFYDATQWRQVSLV